MAERVHPFPVDDDYLTRSGFDAFAQQIGLSPRELFVLALIGEYGPCPPNDLPGLLVHAITIDNYETFLPGITPADLSAYCDTLRQRGYVQVCDETLASEAAGIHRLHEPPCNQFPHVGMLFPSATARTLLKHVREHFFIPVDRFYLDERKDGVVIMRASFKLFLPGDCPLMDLVGGMSEDDCNCNASCHVRRFGPWWESWWLKWETAYEVVCDRNRRIDGGAS
jgi:hypothetical protein